MLYCIDVRPHRLLPVSPGPVGNMSISNTSVNQLTVTWAPPTTGSVPTSYNVSINDSSSPVVIPDNGSSLYTHTFTGLISDTHYTASVVAINCVGTSNVTSEIELTGDYFYKNNFYFHMFFHMRVFRLCACVCVCIS